jgi:ADP-heptose:LPS heptosyltransferase
LGCITLSKELKQNNIDIAFLFYPTPALALSLRLAKIPIRVGTGYRWYSFLVNHRIFQHRKHGLKHELEYNIFLLKDFIKEIPSPSRINFNFSINESLENKKAEIFKKIKISKSYVIIHPGSGGSAPNLPPHKYAKIADYLIENTDVDIILVGDKREYKLLNYIAEKISKNKKVHLISGEWDLEDYTAMIAFCNLFLSNSTGPLHIARALNVPLLAFYCPALPYTPRRWGPYNQIDSVLSPRINYPSRCSTKHCPYQNCLDKIEWSVIKNKIDLILQTSN